MIGQLKHGWSSPRSRATVREGMYLPIIVLRSRTARSLVNSQADANP